MYTFIIIDDDEIQVDLIQMYMSQIDEMECIATFNNAFEAREKIINTEPDLIIVDVEMPGLTGLQLIKSLKQIPSVIFITSHTGYAVEAFEIDAIDYLVKPVTIERLMRAIDKFKFIHSKKIGHTSSSELKFEDKAFFVKDKHIYIKISHEDVLYIESSGNFSIIHQINKSKQLVLANLAKMEAQLPISTFVRISRSLIVNKQYVKSIGNDTLYANEEELTIGKNFLENALKEIIGDKLIKRT